MVAESFPASLAFTLKEEGGNDDDPQDHGGRTSRGIIQTEWNSWRKTHAGLPEDVWQAPQDQVEAIYKEQYWEPYCDKLPAGLDLAFFDFCVNAGRTQAVRSLQKAAGVTVDGMLGMETMGAIESADMPALIRLYANARRAFYHALAQFPRYGSDWIGRTNRCEAVASKMVTAPSVMPAGKSVIASPKANPADIKQPPIMQPETGAVATGVGSGALSTLNQFHDALAPYQGTVKYIEYALIAITLVTFGLTLYGFWHRKQTVALAG